MTDLYMKTWKRMP